MPYAVIVRERQLAATWVFDGDLFHDHLDGLALGFEKLGGCVGVEGSGGDDPVEVDPGLMSSLCLSSGAHENCICSAAAPTAKSGSRSRSLRRRSMAAAFQLPLLQSRSVSTAACLQGF